MRHAAELGLKSYGFDLDPLAVLVSKVSSKRVVDEEIAVGGEKLLKEAAALDTDPELSWIDGDAEAERFVSYWFAEKQRMALRKVAHVLSMAEGIGLSEDTRDVMKVALSRIIITKARAASLARDTSHSRPHRVVTGSDYDVFGGLEKSIAQLRQRLQRINPKAEGVVEHGDARELTGIKDDSIDFVLTSPPYLNALDYMRGHRMSLVWLGHRYSELSKTRSASIGAERAPDAPLSEQLTHEVQSYMGDLNDLPRRQRKMIDRYVADLYAMTSEISRVLRGSATATFVIGDSCLRGVFVSNSNGLAAAAELAGLKEVSRVVRELPQKHRYLPTPENGSLAKRMKKETILTFMKTSD